MFAVRDRAESDGRRERPLRAEQRGPVAAQVRLQAQLAAQAVARDDAVLASHGAHLVAALPAAHLAHAGWC